MRRYSLAELEQFPTLAVGQADDLRVEEYVGRKLVRYWLSRCGVEDGEPYPNKVTIEARDCPNGSWENIETYQAE